jgi:hypothetical protein
MADSRQMIDLVKLVNIHAVRHGTEPSFTMDFAPKLCLELVYARAEINTAVLSHPWNNREI